LRVTHSFSSQIIKANLNKRAESLTAVWQQASSGKRVERPSDDPGAVSRLLSYRSVQSEIEQRRFQAQQGISFLTAADTALSQAEQVLLKAQELATASRSGSAAEDSIRSMGIEVEQFLAELNELAEQKYGDQALFAAGAVHFSAADMADFELERHAVFGLAFAALDQLKDELLAAGPAAAETLNELQKAVEHIRNYHVQVGARTNRLEALQIRLASLEQDLTARRSADEEVDFAQALIDLKEEELAYQAALSATARIMKVSLVDYL
jgi:flagellar hook-associated protein 3 FlgL